MKTERVYKLIFASVYPHYLRKTETKGHTKAELDTIICWLTGYTQKQLQQQIDKKVDLETFFLPRRHSLIPMCQRLPVLFVDNG